MSAKTIGLFSTSRIWDLLVAFKRDEAGSYLTITALLLPVLSGIVGLGTEYGLWMQRAQNIQSAADSGALSAAVGFTGDSSGPTVQAYGVIASYGLVAGSDGVTVNVNRPPLSGKYAGELSAFEVAIQQEQKRLFSALWNSQPLIISARSVALAPNGNGCVLATDATASGSGTLQGSTRVVLNGCSLFINSNSTTALTVGGSSSLFADLVSVVGGASTTAGITAKSIATGQSAIRDPYQESSFPPFSGCSQRNYVAKNTVTISPGVYCGGLNLNAGAIVTMNPGIYYIDGGSLTVNGGATLSGFGVTLVFTSSSGSGWPTVTINGDATVNLTAPTSGSMAGFVLFGDRGMPVGTSFKLNGGASQYFGGAVYLPRAAVSYAGGANTTSSCTQLIADTITFTGNSSLAIDCSHYPIKPIGSTVAKLVE